MRGESGSRLAAQGDALAAAAEQIDRGRRLLARARRVGELLLGPLTLGDERSDLLLEGLPLGSDSGAPNVELVFLAGQAREVEGRNRGLEPRDLDTDLLGALRGGRLESERPQALLDFILEIARALDLDRDPRQLQLGPVPAPFEAAEAGRLLDELTPLGGPRVEHRLDPALRDDRAEAAAEPDVGQKLDEVDPANDRAIDQVLALAAAGELARDGHLGERQLRPRAVGVVEDQLDLAGVHRPRARRAREEHVVGLLGSQLAGAHRAGGPENRIGDVRLP